MCSPSGPSNTQENNSTSVGLINSSSESSTSLQSNQQEPSLENSIKPSSESPSLVEMPLPRANRNRATTTQEMSSKAYNKPGDSLVIAGQDRFLSTRMAPSSSSQHKFNYLNSTSPNSTSDIWAAPSSTSNSTAVTPSSPDYLRDFDEVLTPCTTLSTIPSRTPSEDDSDDPWRMARKALEIPDLVHNMNKVRSPTAIARQPINAYYKKVADVNRLENSKIASPSSLLHRQRQVQSRPIQSTKDVLSSSRDSSLIVGSETKKVMNSTGSTLRKAVTTNRELRDAKQYCEKNRPVLSPTTNNVQGHNYHNQSPHTPQRHHHHRISLNTPRSPYNSKHHHHHPQSWPQSPQHSHSGQRSNPRQSPGYTPKHSHSHGQHQKSHQLNTASSSSVGAGARPTYEILKTLLRKKACLYEPGTSKAIALITWLVGRKLALAHGYFSRQHLQSGVHAVVGDKIDSGMITRTKVNRCMQIILNSCFHYIIPRPDGTEEKGDLFRDSFQRTVSDDSHLLSTLPHPWNDLKITDECLIDKVDDEKEEESDKAASKRIVLLCFNENVRSAEDVLRCHNDFIRDAAITGKLCLSADEWRQFFSLKDDDGSKSDATSVGTTSPILKPVSGCDVPYLSFEMPQDVTTCLDNKDRIPEPWGKSVDVLGQMNKNELNKFRTTWCCKRYDHDHSMCRFAHIEENQGWLRRDPSVYNYEDRMCPHATIIKSSSSELKGCHFNTCPHGLMCKYAHSQEEIDYHPKRYKSKVCESCRSSYNNCGLRDICPNCHPENPRSPPHAKSGRSHHPKWSGDATSKGKGSHCVNTKNSDASSLVSNENVPSPAPILFHKPAPSSEFEKTLIFPGLQSLYRRNCAMLYAHYVSKKDTMQRYSNFEDDWADADLTLVEPTEANNKCFSLYSTLGGK